MPGVPSGRGCDGCRKQKKKCDQSKPACSRCTRLGIACLGAGTQRFKFIQDERASSEVHSSRSPTPGIKSGKGVVLALPPSNGTSNLVGALVQTIKPTTNLSWNIAWTYGPLFLDVPQRLGISEALDAAVWTLVSGHSDLRSQSPQVSERTLELHGIALKALRKCLQNPAKAHTTETLCAVYLLLVCQVFVGSGSPQPLTHTEGAVQLLRSWGKVDQRDALQRKLLATLRGPVIFEGLFNPRIEMSLKEWSELLAQDWSYTNWDDQILCYLAETPSFLRRGRDKTYRGQLDSELLQDVHTRYNAMLLTLDKARERLRHFESTGITEEKEFVHLAYQRIYGISLLVATIFNCLVSSLSTGNPGLDAEAESFSQEVLILAEQSHRYRPLGSSYITLCLIVAYVGASWPATRSAVTNMLNEYRCDFPWLQSTFTVKNLDATSRYLRCENTSSLCTLG